MLLSLNSRAPEHLAQFADVKSALINAEATVLLPQSVTLRDIAVASEFIYAHALVQSSDDQHRFITLDGVMGLFDRAGERLFVVGRVPSFRRDELAPDTHYFSTLAPEWDAFDVNAASERAVVVIDRTFLELETANRGLDSAACGRTSGGHSDRGGGAINGGRDSR